MRPVEAERQGPKGAAAIGSTAPADSRRAARYTCIQLLWYCSLEDHTKRGLARTVDVSARGVGLVAAHQIMPEERLFVVMVTRFGRVALLGRVMYVQESEPGSYRVGVEVEVIPPADKSTWLRLLREVRR
jgi:hypothetical protein